MFEVLSEIIAVSSILMKFGREDILEDKKVFIAFVNELGIRYNNRRITVGLLSDMVLDITVRQKEKLIEEFNSGFEPLYRQLSLYNNNSKY